MEFEATKGRREDGEGDLLAVAKLLISISRSSTFESWPPLSDLSSKDRAAPARNNRAERDIKERKKENTSPTTPLSWSGRSGSSGGLCDDGWTASSSPPKRHRRGSLGGDPYRLPRSSPKPSSLQPQLFRSNQEPMMAAGAADGGPMRSTAYRLKSAYTSSMGDRRQGKKKTVTELRAMKDSLLQEQVELRKELDRQEAIYGVLLEENSLLKKMESSSRSPPMKGVDLREVNANTEGATGSFSFDLNSLPDDGA